MANTNTAIVKTLVNEGGYAYPMGTSGETYKGVDRLHHPNWAGWGIIDAIKRTRRIKQYETIANDTLNKLVVDFYKLNFWPKSQAGLLSNDDLASLYFDFYFHKPAIAILAMNDIAVFYGLLVTQVSNKGLSKEVIAAANTNPAKFYKKLHELRLLHYKNQYRNKLGKTVIVYKKAQKGVIDRALRYPAELLQTPESGLFFSQSWAAI